MGSMCQIEHGRLTGVLAKERPTTRALLRFKNGYAPELRPVHFRAAIQIDDHMGNVPDEAHRSDHNAEMLDIACMMFDADHALAEKIDKPRLVEYIIVHDLFRSSILWLNPATFVLGQYFEHVFAVRPAMQFFRSLGYQEQQVEDIGEAVAVHAFSPADLRSKSLPYDATRLLFNDLDNVSVLSRRRVNQMIRYLYRSFGKLPVQAILPYLAEKFEKDTDAFTYHFDVTRSEAIRRRNDVLPYVRRIAQWNKHPQKGKNTE